jgi:uncharacterized protein YukE
MVEVAGGGGASSSGSDGTTYNIKPNSVPPPGEEQSMQYPEIMAILHNLKPKDVASAGDAFKNLANVLDSIATDLANTGNQLSNSWQGAAAQAAMNKFQQLHDQAAQLAANAHNTASVAYWLGNDVLPQYQSIPSPEVMSKSESDSIIGSTLGPGGMMGGAILGAFGVGSDGTGKANNAARGYLASLNGHIATGIQQLPNYVSGPNPGDTGNQPWQTPPRGGPGPGYGSPVTGYPPGGYGGGAPLGGGGGMPPYSPPGGGRVPPPKLPSGSGGPAPTGTLQGYSPPPGGGTPSPFGGGSPGGMPGGGSANPFSRLGMMPGGGPGGGGPGEGLAGDTAAADGAVGDAAAADGAAAGEAAGAAGAEGAEGAGMAGMPMGGSGSGQQDKERQRQAWMHEDEDIWGVPKDDVGPVIG